jgi:hypothetical protein
MFMLVLFASLWASNAHAQWLESGKPVPDTQWRKAWGQNGAMLHLTDKPGELFEAWEKPAAGVPVSTTEVATRGEPLVGVIFFSGCTPDTSGMCDARAKLQVFKPDGSPYGDEELVEIWVGKPAFPSGQLQLSVDAIGVVIEPHDPIGTYTVRAQLHDLISGAEVELKRTFSVETAADATGKPPAAQQDDEVGR